MKKIKIRKQTHKECREFSNIIIDVLVKNNFISGWFGDKSKGFVREQKDSFYLFMSGQIEEKPTYIIKTLINVYYSLQSCMYEKKENEFLSFFGFKDINELLTLNSVYNPKIHKNIFIENYYQGI